MSIVTIYHNPKCSKSRETLALLREHGVKTKVVLYLDNPPTVGTLENLLKQLGFSSARELMRSKEDLYHDLQLDDQTLTQEQLFTIMHANPKLMERPIVIANGKARIGRPPENVLEII